MKKLTTILGTSLTLSMLPAFAGSEPVDHSKMDHSQMQVAEAGQVDHSKMDHSQMQMARGLHPGQQHVVVGHTDDMSVHKMASA